MLYLLQMTFNSRLLDVWCKVYRIIVFVYACAKVFVVECTLLCGWAYLMTFKSIVRIANAAAIAENILIPALNLLFVCNLTELQPIKYMYHPCIINWIEIINSCDANCFPHVCICIFSTRLSIYATL